MRERVLDGSIGIGSKFGRQYIVYGGLNAPKIKVGGRSLGFELFWRAEQVMLGVPRCDTDVSGSFSGGKLARLDRL